MMPVIEFKKNTPDHKRDTLLVDGKEYIILKEGPIPLVALNPTVQYINQKKLAGMLRKHETKFKSNVVSIGPFTQMMRDSVRGQSTFTWLYSRLRDAF